MSNIANTIQYLQASEDRFLRINIQETNKVLGKNDIYLKDIPNLDLEHYIKFHLGSISKPTLVWVEMRSKQGTTSKKDHGCAIEILPVINAETNHYNLTNESRNAPISKTNNQESMTNNFGTFGLGFAEVIGMQVKADRLEHKEEQLSELKEEYKELKQKYNLLDVEHRGTLTKLSTSEAQKEMAVMIAKSENKSIFESSAFEKLMEKAPELLGSIVAMKSGGTVPTGALGSPIPDGHREFVDHVIENLDENQVNFLGSICHYIDNPAFMNQLQLLIQQFSTHA